MWKVRVFCKKCKNTRFKISNKIDGRRDEYATYQGDISHNWDLNTFKFKCSMCNSHDIIIKIVKQKELHLKVKEILEKEMKAKVIMKSEKLFIVLSDDFKKLDSVDRYIEIENLFLNSSIYKGIKTKSKFHKINFLALTEEEYKDILE